MREFTELLVVKIPPGSCCVDSESGSWGFVELWPLWVKVKVGRYLPPGGITHIMLIIVMVCCWGGRGRHCCEKYICEVKYIATGRFAASQLRRGLGVQGLVDSETWKWESSLTAVYRLLSAVYASQRYRTVVISELNIILLASTICYHNFRNISVRYELHIGLW